MAESTLESEGGEIVKMLSFAKKVIPKISSEMRRFLVKLFGTPVIVLVRLLEPFVLIRFGPLRSRHIGHLAANTELYLCERDAGIHGWRVWDFFYHSGPICNRQLAKMWGRVIHISLLNKWLNQINRRIRGWEKHTISIYHRGDIDCINLLDGTKPHLYFTSKEEQRGFQKLRQLGIPSGHSKFVCFYARDSAYLDSVLGPPKRGSWQHHDYRNASISNYIAAMEEMVRRGYFALRVGALVKEPLNCNGPNIIDYASCGRDEFMDIFLGAKCGFFVGSTGGANAVPRIFRRPMVYVNFIPLGIVHLFACAPSSLLIPKKLWLRKEKRFLTFREIIKIGADEFWLSEQYDQLDIDVVENTAEEILAVTVEMDERLKGKWKETEEDETQSCFWELFTDRRVERPGVNVPPEFLPHNRHWIDFADKRTEKPNIRIGAEFLRQNKQLLR